MYTEYSLMFFGTSNIQLEMEVKAIHFQLNPYFKSKFLVPGLDKLVDLEW